ncbi:hypothetical protein Pan14r_20570 [Crateriforma conspicua]|uniref:Uncharacterized protein n=1 Tax=Crateriforma conspicua TaxID=2527996 RepID=A0A5C5Y687_9PLAN|nr:hypothetical protein Mal65_35170 [Crateriforma conspicua]TWT69765.1 hypothetical protein Pan14r_20570 [Crateriforma conspicua]
MDLAARRCRRSTITITPAQTHLMKKLLMRTFLTAAIGRPRTNGPMRPASRLAGGTRVL